MQLLRKSLSFLFLFLLLSTALQAEFVASKKSNKYYYFSSLIDRLTRVNKQDAILRIRNPLKP